LKTRRFRGLFAAPNLVGISLVEAPWKRQEESRSVKIGEGERGAMTQMTQL
jgi:hypothetical protein